MLVDVEPVNDSVHRFRSIADSSSREQAELTAEEAMIPEVDEAIPKEAVKELSRLLSIF